MVEYQYNQPHYKLECSELEEDTFHVYAFEGEESISRLFEYRIELISEQPDISASDILNKKATFFIMRGEEDPIYIHGIISHFEQRGCTPDYVSYYAVLVPKMWRLTLNHASKIIQNKSIEEMISEILEENGLTHEDFEFQLNGSYPELQYCVQYNETDFNFINRRCEQFGIYYYFAHRNDNDVIVFTDHIDALEAIDSESIPYNANKDPLSEQETVKEIVCQEKVITGKYQLKDYNYEYPDRTLFSEAQIDSEVPGTFYEFGGHFQDASEGDQLAKIRSEQQYCTQKVFKGKTDCRCFHAGYKYTLEGHYREDWNQELILTGIKVRGIQHNLFAFFSKTREHIPTYENSFEAIPVDREFRPAIITPVPRIPGVMTAKLETGSGDEYAFIDDQGRYRLKTFFDLSDQSNGEASCPIRLAQPYAGPGYGLHFPNHADAEMVWACIDGNVDRPIGLSTVPNPNQSSPVISNNRTQNIIRTAAGNELVMDDKIEEAQISVTTPDANRMCFDDRDDRIEIMTTQKHKIVMDDKNENITLESTSGHFMLVDDKNKKMTVQSKEGHRISINDADGNITVVDKDGENTIVIDIANSKIVIRTENGDIDMHAPNGTIDIKATTLNIETTGDTIHKSANIAIEAQEDYTLQATNITEEAGMDLKESGMNVTSEASMAHKTKGLNVTSEAGANHEVKASAINTIKGSMVMIN